MGRDSNHEEAELQEAIRRSLQHDSADSADINAPSTIADHDNPRPPEEVPPPYNPSYSPPGLLSSETEIVPEPETTPTTNSVRRRLTTSSAQRDRENGRTSSSASDMDRVRAARLKRFTDNQSS